MPRLHLLLAALCISSPAPASPLTAQPEPLATTQHGPISGYVDQGIFAFPGIPYGGDTAPRRFKAPVPPDPWTGIRACTEFGPMAILPIGYESGSKSGPGSIQSEDCLRLNVWTPSLRDGEKRPVLVYFHGGAYNGGAVNSDLYDGVLLCKKGDVVVVTVNHHLNGFGFLFLGDLVGPGYADSGNAGMLDLVLALKWVRDNSAELGGEPGCVTIFGQSGGGAKCATLMAMPAARGLFHRIWTMSSQQLTGRIRKNATTAARSWEGRVLESERRALQNGAPTYVYYVNWPSPVDGGKWKAPHMIDIPLVFDNVAQEKLTKDFPEAQKLADLMSDALLAFARTGNPNTTSLPAWPSVNVEKRPTMHFDSTTRVEDDPRGAERLLFARANYIQPGT